MNRTDELLRRVEFRRQEWPFGVQVYGELKFGAGVGIPGSNLSSSMDNLYARAQIRQDIASSLYGDLREELTRIERNLRHMPGAKLVATELLKLQAVIDSLYPADAMRPATVISDGGEVPT